MAPGSGHAETVVNVSSGAELVETQRTSTTDTIGQTARIDNLPINGRNYINFALTDSQVLRDNAPNIGAAPTSGLNMSGQRAPLESGKRRWLRRHRQLAQWRPLYCLAGGRAGIPDHHQRLAAEYGRASGGVVNIITRSGSNDFHGDVYGYLRNRNFQAANPFSNVPHPAYTRVQAGHGIRWANQERSRLITISLTKLRGGMKPDLPALGAPTTFAWSLSTQPASPPLLGCASPLGTLNLQVTPQQAAFRPPPPGSTPRPPSGIRPQQQYAAPGGRVVAPLLSNGSYPAVA